MEMCGCDFENKYEMFNINKNNGKKKGMCLFKATEESGCCSRNCCKGAAKPLKIKIEHVSAGSNKDGELFLELDKPCVCFLPGMCCNRPMVNVYLTEDRKKDHIGKIELPCQMCSHELVIKDPQDNEKFRIVGACC